MKEIFPYMNNILYNGLQMMNDITSKRMLLYEKKDDILEETGIEYSYDDWNELPQGRFDVELNSYKFSCIFNKKETGPLYVILNGSLLYQKPEFKRWSYYSFLDGSMLNIADPMYYKYDDLKLGWYYGDTENNLREYLSCIITKAAQIIGLSNKEIVILGSSGGGAAAIHVGHLINGSTVIAINSQVKLSLYYYSETFKQITGIDLDRDDKFGRNDTINLLNNSSGKTKFILLDNVRSSVDCDQLNHIASILPHVPSYGLTQYGNLILWLYEAVAFGKSGEHGAQEYHEILFAILHLRRIMSYSGFVEEYKPLYLLFSEFWSEHFRLIDKTDATIKSFLREVKRITIVPSVLDIEKCKNSICKKNITLSANNKEKYKSIDVCKQLKANCLYCFCLKNISFLCGEETEFTVLIRDKQENVVYCREDYNVNDEIKYFFLTNESVNDLVLRVYAGRVAHTVNCTLKIGEMCLCELS